MDERGGRGERRESQQWEGGPHDAVSEGAASAPKLFLSAVPLTASGQTLDTFCQKAAGSVQVSVAPILEVNFPPAGL